MLTSTVQAKQIVRRDLQQWRGSLSSLRGNLGKVLTTQNFKNVAQREKYIKKHRKKSLSGFYCKEISTSFSNTLAFISAVENENKEVRKQSSVNKKYNKFQEKTKSAFHVFVVKDDISFQSGLHLIMCNIRSKKSENLGSFYSVVRITNHCLERVVERLNLKNIREALDEILSAVDLFDASGHELSVRTSKNQKPEFKRHIPTPNGACLLQTSNIEDSNGESVQSCNLVTWIHRKQFFESQEITNKKYNYVQSINTYLSMIDFDDVIEKWKKGLNSIENESDENSKSLVSINGELYDLPKFISDLEKREFLDFEIDFERYKSNEAS